MDIKKQSRLKFKGVDILNVDYKALQPFEQTKSKLKTNITPKIFFPKDILNSFQVVMNVEIIAENSFNLKVLAVGNFEFGGNVSVENRKTFSSANATAIMFPYIRAFISTLTSNLGSVTGTIILPTQFFKGELEEFKPDEKKEELIAAQM
jgi:preprotein translocase subunit SecB